MKHTERSPVRRSRRSTSQFAELRRPCRSNARDHPSAHSPIRKCPRECRDGGQKRAAPRRSPTVSAKSACRDNSASTTRASSIQTSCRSMKSARIAHTQTNARGQASPSFAAEFHPAQWPEKSRHAPRKLEDRRSIHEAFVHEPGNQSTESVCSDRLEK